MYLGYFCGFGLRQLVSLLEVGGLEEEVKPTEALALFPILLQIQPKSEKPAVYLCLLWDPGTGKVGQRKNLIWSFQSPVLEL